MNKYRNDDHDDDMIHLQSLRHMYGHLYGTALSHSYRYHVKRVLVSYMAKQSQLRYGT